MQEQEGRRFRCGYKKRFSLDGNKREPQQANSTQSATIEQLFSYMYYSTPAPKNQVFTEVFTV